MGCRAPSEVADEGFGEPGAVAFGGVPFTGRPIDKVVRRGAFYRCHARRLSGDAEISGQ